MQSYEFFFYYANFSGVFFLKGVNVGGFKGAKRDYPGVSTPGHEEGQKENVSQSLHRFAVMFSYCNRLSCPCKGYWVCARLRGIGLTHRIVIVLHAPARG